MVLPLTACCSFSCTFATLQSMCLQHYLQRRLAVGICSVHLPFCSNLKQLRWLRLLHITVSILQQVPAQDGNKTHVKPLVGVAVAFQANDLPNPLVEISATNKPSHVSWTKHTLNPKFPNMEPAMYDRLPNDTIITVKMFDNKGTLTNRRRRVLLGSSSVCCAHFTGADPLYVWLPMREPRKRRRNKSGLQPPPGHIPDIQAIHPPSHACIPHLLRASETRL